MKLDEREFSNKFAQATQHLSPEEKQAVFKLFAGISQQLASENPVPQAAAVPQILMMMKRSRA